jgi:hypothetical protein
VSLTHQLFASVIEVKILFEQCKEWNGKPDMKGDALTFFYKRYDFGQKKLNKKSFWKQNQKLLLPQRS